MAAYGYSYVDERGFIAFLNDLDTGSWHSISIKKVDKPDGMLAKGAVDLPRAVGWKLRLTWGIRAVQTASSASSLDAFDTKWDAAQRRLAARVTLAEADDDVAVSEAGGRARAALLSGTGSAQTQLEYDQEIDFGRAQVHAAAQPALAADVKKAGLAQAIADIGRETEAFAEAMGRGVGKGTRRPARKAQIREALATCSAAFNAVHDDVSWLKEHAADPAEQSELADLLAPLEGLLSRFPAPAKGAPSAPASAPPVGPTVPAAPQTPG